MNYKLLITSSSFWDAPGKHKEALKKYDFLVDYVGGPLKENEILEIIGNYDAVICGDDEYTRKVLEKGKASNLLCLSKYGVGLDKIDLNAAKELGIPVTNCLGVNHTTVAEHVFALLLSFVKNIPQEYNFYKQNKWNRITGHEVNGKNIGILGLGKIGKEVAKRARAFGMHVYAFDKFIDENFVKEHNVQVCKDVSKLISESDYLSLNTPLTKETEKIISAEQIRNFAKPDLIIINTARGKLVDIDAVIEALHQQKIGGYLTDVLDVEPMVENHPLVNCPNVIVTPHIGSRTFENIENQGLMAVENLVKILKLPLYE